MCTSRIVSELLRVSPRSCKISSHSTGTYRYINHSETPFPVILKLGTIIHVYEKKKPPMNIIENVIADDWMTSEHLGSYTVLNEVDNEIPITN